MRLLGAVWPFSPNTEDGRMTGADIAAAPANDVLRAVRRDIFFMIGSRLKRGDLNPIDEIDSLEAILSPS